MHPSIFKEFDVAFGNIDGLRPGPDGRLQPTRVLHVRLRHAPTQADTQFALPSDTGAPDRWVEEQVMRQFPDSVAAAELRAVYGVTRHELKQGWDLALGDRIFTGLTERCDTPGGRFWSALIPALPPVLYTTMNERAVANVRKLGAEVELRSVIKAVHSAWFAVLREARTLPTHISGLQALQMDLVGWPTEHLQGMSLQEYGQFKERAMYGLLALSFLKDEDWTTVLSPILQGAAPRAAAATQPEEN